MDEQTEHLDRVKAKISQWVLEFLTGLGPGAEFHMHQLSDYVKQQSGVAPDSPGRILRDLRQKNEIRYEVVHRRSSLYRFLGFPGEHDG